MRMTKPVGRPEQVPGSFKAHQSLLLDTLILMHTIINNQYLIDWFINGTRPVH